MNAAAPKPLAVGDSPADPGDDADADLEARVNRILNNAKSFGVK